MIKNRITLKQLEAFVYVVDTGTFRAAAAALGTTQPNISSRIAALESALQVVLLYRDAGSVRVSEKGQVLLARARDVLWAGEALLDEAGRQELIEERLRLGVTELIACTWLQDFLRRLKGAYPSIRVELQVDLSTAIDERLSEGLLDLAIQSGPFRSELPGTLPLGLEPYVWVTRRDIADELGQTPDMTALFARPVLTHAKHTQAGLALHAMAKDCGLDASQIVHSSALSACLPMVHEGFGVALLPSALVRGDLLSGKIRTLATEWLPDPLSFFARYHKSRAPLFVRSAAKLAAAAAAEHSKKLSMQQNKSI
ncbi:MAG: LysR family transcriptional regulator [Pseudomonadota bacterium]